MHSPELIVTDTLTELVATRQHLAQIAKAAQKEVDRVSDDIKNEMMARGLDSHDAGEFKATLTVRSRVTLDEGELVARGVSTEVIAASKKSKDYVQLDVREAK